MIPIKGYATFDPLKHCWIGSGFKTEWFSDLPIYKNNRIMNPLKRIAEETEEDYQALDKILKDAGVQTYRSFLDLDKAGSLKNIYRPPVNPRDHFAVIGEKLYAVGGKSEGYASVLKQIERQNIVIEKIKNISSPISTANICRVGKDLWWDIDKECPDYIVDKYKKIWQNEGFRVHISNRGYHSDSSFCVVKPGCIVSLKDIQDYKTEFPGWDVLYLPDQSWSKVDPFMKMKDKVGGQWWLKGEEHNDELIQFVNTWLTDWVGYVEETVFDVNMLSIDQNTIICNNYNKEVFEHFKKHKVEPIVFNFRHRYFWDGGIHCITQDLYREGTQEDYLG
jgi:hypothetical protein|tara:strand:- start:682 stop:1686 length:1005 start_codon:yes stop_codon:yes gene_type:complete